MIKNHDKSWRIFFVVLYFLTFSIAFCLVKFGGFQISSEAIKDFCTFLATISGMVFTIMGIWIAFLYPNALLKFTNPEKIENIDFSYGGVEAKRLSYIVSSVLISSVVMMALGFYFFIRIFLKPVGFSYDVLLTIKSLLTGCLSIVFLMQIQSVFAVIFANIMFLNDIYERRKNIIIDND